MDNADQHPRQEYAVYSHADEPETGGQEEPGDIVPFLSIEHFVHGAHLKSLAPVGATAVNRH
ncbi:hypothetical protein NLO72_20335 [Pseudomonas tremae]|uniref:hypothetical protein n=1 Tax=Pseudomonas tremae TaxID=200454 RepID=UPI001F235A15|nr:hypothetical protein [Pseudomonas tremae]MCQ2991564.1 hypothetical protein [Pseudomonas tremae]